MNLGQKITALRTHKRLTQEQVAEMLGVKRARYNAWENNIANPDHVMLIAISRLHGVTVDFLLSSSDLDGIPALPSDKASASVNKQAPDTIAAHHEGDEWTEEEREEIEQFKQFVRSKRKE